jgi:hypothetical protein
MLNLLTDPIAILILISCIVTGIKIARALRII